MKINKLSDYATDKSKFNNLNDFIKFSNQYLSYISNNLQATIISNNNNEYCFYQYDKSADFQITRPINSKLMFDNKNFDENSKEFLKILKNIKKFNKKDKLISEIINKTTYTIQQTIGAALDALPIGKSNTARKLNGDLFEHFIRLILKEIGLCCDSGVIKIPVIMNKNKLFDMSYQHDLIVKKNGNTKLIGSIKTSSKDRIDKIFIDKFLYNKLTEKITPHIAIFLNDVQRKKTKKENVYSINSTFLPGHFKGYTVKLNPLDGVYYCDILPNMQKDSLLKKHIKTFDKLLTKDIWKFV